MKCFKCICTVLLVHVVYSILGSETALSRFRILAPQYVCPKDDDAVLEKMDNTIITVQTSSGSEFRALWTVRWKHLLNPKQRFTVTLWKTVRDLEKKLNGPQPEPLVYVIENSELLPGVDYIFNVSEVISNNNLSAPKSFNIDNTQGDQKLVIEGRTDMLSVILIGSQVAYSDVEYVLEVEVTACYPTQDYYFVWAVTSGFVENVDVSQINGSRLEIPPGSLKVGLVYNVNCQLISHSDGHTITETGLPFRVSPRGLEAYLSVDYIIVTANYPFYIEATIFNHDNDDSINIEWHCVHENESCNYFEENGHDRIYFPSGLLDVGNYEIILIISTNNESVTRNATVISVEPELPLIQINPIPRILNEGTIISVTANVSNLSPNCTYSWYFATEEYLSSNEQHGVPLLETLTIQSIEENFLNELADYTNDTEWRQVTAEFTAAAGRARFWVDCGCSLTFNCDRIGIVYADVSFSLNESPKPGGLMISPESGTALETVFRISTLEAIDSDDPLLYNFYCNVSPEEDLLLGSIVEHRALETILPYIEGGTEVWVEVCDVRGACRSTVHRTISLTAGEGRTILSLIEDMKAHSRRCEIIALTRVIKSALITYNNIGRPDLCQTFSNALQDSLSELDECSTNDYDAYSNLLKWIKYIGHSQK